MLPMLGYCCLHNYLNVVEMAELGRSLGKTGAVAYRCLLVGP